jgi:general secretion pathway protein E
MTSSRAATPLPNANGATTPQVGGQADGLDLADGLGAFLIERGVIDGAVLDRARRAARTTGERFDRVLTKLGLLSEADLTAALSTFLSIPKASLSDVPGDPILPDAIKADFVRRNRVMPLALGEVRSSWGGGPSARTAPGLAFLTDLSVSAACSSPPTSTRPIRLSMHSVAKPAVLGIASEASEVDCSACATWRARRPRSGW